MNLTFKKDVKSNDSIDFFVIKDKTENEDSIEDYLKLYDENINYNDSYEEITKMNRQ